MSRQSFALLSRQAPRLAVEAQARHAAACLPSQYIGSILRTQRKDFAHLTSGPTSYQQWSTITRIVRIGFEKRNLPVASFSSQKDGEADAEVENEKEIRQMPVNLTTLVSRGEGWPSLLNIAVLNNKCSQAGVSITQVEKYLISYFRSKTKSEGKKKKETNFYSKHMLNKWLKSKSSQDLEKYLRYMETNIYQKKDESGLPLKRLEYVIAIWRLLLILESLLPDINQGDETQMPPDDKFAEVTVFLDQFADKAHEMYGDSLPSLILRLAQLQFFKEEPILSDDEVKDLSQFLADFSSKYVHSGGKTPLVTTLQLVNYSQLCQKIIDGASDNMIKSQLLLAQSGIHWKFARFSDSLESLSLGTELALSNCPPSMEQDKAVTELYLMMCNLWRNIIQASSRREMVPALEYLVMQAEIFSKSDNNLGTIPAYILSISLKEVKGFDDFIKTLDNRIPEPVRWEKFERCFYVTGMTEETKTFFLGEYIKRLAAIEKEPTPTQPPASMETAEDATTTSEEFVETQGSWGHLQQEMFDIAVLERVSQDNVRSLIDLLLTEGQKQHLPGPEATEAVLSYLTNNKDIDSLNLLYRGMPENSELKERFYLEGALLELKKILNMWEIGRNMEAWIMLVELYRSLLSDKSEARILLQTGEKIIAKCRASLRLFIEETAESMENLRPAIKAGGLKVASDHRDAFILVSLWEALFFAYHFELQQEAEKLLEEFPQIVRFLQIESIISRADRYKREEIYRRLIEVVLRYDASSYIKSRAFESLLSFQTKHGYLSSAEQTVKTARSLDIKITADYLQDFLFLKEDMADRGGMFTRIKNIFSGRRPQTNDDEKK